MGLQHDFFRLVYFSTHVRGAAFLIGIILGCNLTVEPQKTFIASKVSCEILTNQVI